MLGSFFVNDFYKLRSLDFSLFPLLEIIRNKYKRLVHRVIVNFFIPQKARLARIRIAKASSGAAFVSKKKAAEARLAAQESGLQLDENYKEEDIFELQHHHLLRCLEKTTVSEIIFKSIHI